MKRIKCKEKSAAQFHRIETTFNKLITQIKAESDSQKKIVEVCHIEKFLRLHEEEIEIEKLSEAPDFIIKVDGKLVGLEHQAIIDNSVMAYEGFFDNVLELAETDFQRDETIPNFLANVYFKADLKFRISEKGKYVDTIKSLVRHYLRTSQLLRNDLIDDIHTMPHSQKNLCANFGGWCQKFLTPDLILGAISQKEIKYETYVRNNGLEQWLLLVAGNIGNSSYVVREEFPVSITSKFNKIYLMEDFGFKLFEL